MSEGRPSSEPGGDHWSVSRVVSGGQTAAVRAAEVAQRLDRPWLCAATGDLDRVADWVSGCIGGAPPVLDIAGPRESEDPGVQAAAYATLVALLSRPRAPGQ